MILLAAACVFVLNAQAQYTTFTLQVVEFNKVDIRPALCSSHASVASTDWTTASISGKDNEAVLQWVSGSDNKKITVEGKQIEDESSLHVIVRPMTENVNVRAPAVAVVQNVVRDLLFGGSPNSGKAEARIMYFDTSLRKRIVATQTVVYTVLDS
jgi:hypothetical protein